MNYARKIEIFYDVAKFAICGVVIYYSLQNVIEDGLQNIDLILGAIVTVIVFLALDCFIL